MSLQQTALTAPITFNQVGNIGVASTAAFPPVGTPFVNQTVLIDNEYMSCIGVPMVNVITLGRRGIEGSAAVAHDTLSNVYTTVNNADWGPVPTAVTAQNDPSDDIVISIGQDSTITPATGNVAYNINKLTACNITLNAPALMANGVSVEFTSQTAAAHVITATGLINDGTSGSPHNLATFAAQKGATITFTPENGFYNVQALQNVVVS
jgi:hypothetical protein